MADRRHRDVPFSYDRLPPHDVEAEEAVIASALVDEHAAGKLVPIVKPEEFFRTEHGLLWSAITDLTTRGEIANQITVAHELSRRNRLEDAGGQTAMAEMIRRLPSSVGCEWYAGIVHRMAQYRGLIQAAYSVAELAYSTPADFESAYGKALETVLQAADGADTPGSDVATAAEVLKDGLPGVTVAANAAVSYPLPRTWRVVWTIGGTTPSFTITGIQVSYIN